MEYLVAAVIPLDGHEAASKEKSSNASSPRWKVSRRFFEFPKVSWIQPIWLLKLWNRVEEVKEGKKPVEVDET
jgi:hypothetical protein